jgi:DnaJ like chaperone protein
MEEIKAAYKKLASQYHPDKVQHLGKEFQQMAHEKFVSIQKAYDKLKARR